MPRVNLHKCISKKCCAQNGMYLLCWFHCIVHQWVADMISEIYTRYMNMKCELCLASLSLLLPLHLYSCSRYLLLWQLELPIRYWSLIKFYNRFNKKHLCNQWLFQTLYILSWLGSWAVCNSILETKFFWSFIFSKHCCQVWNKFLFWIQN